MSGGVDSSVAALLLKKQGYDVTGVFMKCWSGGPSASLRADCTAEADATDARRVAEHIGIPFYVWDFKEQYKKKVVNYMISGYRKGITPNPDVMCNREIKFGLFFKKALKLGADYVATGHYVALRNTKKYEYMKKRKDDSYIRKKFVFRSLFQAKDTNKDQSYFLWTLTQKQLQHCLFPIGEYTKPQVRALARRAGLSTADKKDSQGICFLGKVTIADFLKRYLPEKRGAVLLAPSEAEGTTTYRKIGEHVGAHFYTIGQRHGLDLKSKNRELGIKGETETKAHYVVSKDVKSNTVVVAEGGDDPALYRKEVELTDVNFVRPIIHNSNFIIPVLARVRYRQPLFKARIMNYESGSRNKNARRKTVIRNSKFMILKFDHPVKFVAPGQSAVLYSKRGELLGGGVIL